MKQVDFLVGKKSFQLSDWAWAECAVDWVLLGDLVGSMRKPEPEPTEMMRTPVEAQTVQRVVKETAVCVAWWRGGLFRKLSVAGLVAGLVVLLVVGWGGTRGAIVSACEEARRDGLAVSNIHLRHLNPFTSDLGEVISRFEKVLVAELNAGQLVLLLRAEFLIDAQRLTKLEGQPFRIQEIRARIDALIQEN